MRTRHSLILFATLSCCAIADQGASLIAEDNTSASAWQIVEIPEAWIKSPGGNYGGGDGYTWYRAAVVVPESWKGRDLELFIEPIDDAREVFLNGERIGGAGDFPPKYRSGLGDRERHSVAAGIVRYGKPNLIAIRVYKNQGRGGFNVAAPVLFGGEEAIWMQGKWQVQPGDDIAWAKWDSAETPPDDTVFTKVEDATIVAESLKKLQGDDGPLAPEDAIKRLRVPDDLSLELVLSDEAIGQPLSMKWDERGRLWVVEYLQYPNPAGLKMVSRDKHLRTVYDKVPPAPPNHFRGADKISIHEDTDGDGTLDKHTTFVDGLSLVSSFARGRGGVWVLNPPYLLFYPDKNDDDVPDGDPEVHLEGFGIEDSHSIANNLCWGPDGWLYACQGSTVTGHIKRPGSDAEPVHSMGQLVWRYHPEARRYEIFAEGGGNAFGLEIDSKGRIYSGHNGGDTRGFHYIQGGYYQKGFGKHGALSNPYTFGYFGWMAHHSVPRFTHTFVIYEGGGLSGQYQGRLFGVAPLHSHVVMADVEQDRSSFKSKDVGHPLTSTDPWFRPVDIQVGPDGAIYVADMYEQRIDHASHYQGRVHKSSGRIYRLESKGAAAAPRFDYAKLSTAELVGVLGHENKWHRQTALRLIGDRKDKSVVRLLEQTIDENSDQLALEAIWALHLSGGLDDAAAIKALQHDNPYVRLWTARLLCDDHKVSDAVALRLTELAATEPNVQARSQLACSARRLPAKQALPIVRQLLTHSTDSDDLHVPLSLWWAIESKCDSDRAAVIDMFRDTELWNLDIVRNHILERLMRRFAQAGTRKDLLTCAELLELAPEKQHSELLLTGFEKAYEGRSLSNLPDELLAALSRAGGGSLALRLRQAEPDAIDEALAIIADEKTLLKQRVLYIGILGQIDQPRCVPVLLKLLEQANDDVRAAALNALQAYDGAAIGSAVVGQYHRFSDNSRAAAQTMLSSRRSWSIELLNAIDDGKIKQDSISMDVVRRILLHQDKQVATMVEKHWGNVQGATTEEMLRDIERFTHVINTGSGNPYNGERLFLQTCGKCHTLFDQGGYIGPDLTAYRRDDLQRMLLNVVNPSVEIREGFENYVVFTDDGRVLNGFISDQDNRVVVIRDAEGQTTTVPRDEIEEMRAVSRSIMPEGLLKTLSEQEVRDLFAYLRATQPVP